MKQFQDIVYSLSNCDIAYQGNVLLICSKGYIMGFSINKMPDGVYCVLRMHLLSFVGLVLQVCVFV